MREWVKRSENKILQCQTTFPSLEFILHLRIIPHAWMYHLIPQSWSYTPPTKPLSSTPCHIIRCWKTSDHYFIIQNNPATHIEYSYTISASFIASIVLSRKSFHNTNLFPNVLISHWPNLLLSVVESKPCQYSPIRFEVNLELLILVLAFLDVVVETPVEPMLAQRETYVDL